MGRGLPPETFGEAVARLRRRKGYSQEELGDRLGRVRATIQKWEAGEHLPTEDVLPTLATELGVSEDTLKELLGLIEPPPPDEELVSLADGAEDLAVRLRALANEASGDPLSQEDKDRLRRLAGEQMGARVGFHPSGTRSAGVR